MNDEKTSILGALPVKRLYGVMGVPMVLSMMLQALYNIVDSAFVSNMKTGGESALQALTLAFPMQMLMVAVGVGTGVGVNALLSRTLGEGDMDKAKRTVGCGVMLSAVIYGAFLLFGLFGAKAYILSQTADSEVAEMAVEYLTICCVWSMGIVFFSLFEKVLQATGRSLFSTIAQISGAVTNIILDPILIYGLLGLPEMGVRGAAWATVIGQVVSAAVGLIFHINRSKELSGSLRPVADPALIRAIYSIGLPAIIAQALMSLMTYLLNLILGAVSGELVTAYGLFYKIQQFILFAAFGLRDAITPIVSFAAGSRDSERVSQGIRWGVIYTCAVMLAGAVGVEVFARPLAGVFGLSETTESLCISAMRVISLCFVFAGFNIALQGVFQALGGGLQSLAISLGRQLIFVIPPAWGLSLAVRNGAPGWLIWLAFPIGEVLCAVMAFALFRRLGKSQLAPEPARSV